MKSEFKFWCPVDIKKAIDDKTGEEIMLLGGIASTADEDSDGEFLDPKGFDIKPLMEKGLVNWHHQAKTNPGTIVGEPTKAEIRKEGLYIETKLYPSSPVAVDIWNLAKTLESDSDTRPLHLPCPDFPCPLKNIHSTYPESFRNCSPKSLPASREEYAQAKAL